jgi:hypothetical protein
VAWAIDSGSTESCVRDSNGNFTGDTAGKSLQRSSVLIADTGLVRAWLEPLTRKAFNGDDSVLALIHADSRLAASWAEDSAALAAWTAAGNVREWLLDLTVGRIGGELFMDLARDDTWIRGPLGGRLSTATHGLWHLTVTEQELTLTPLDDAWLSEGLDSGWIALPFTEVEGGSILTAPTDSLRRFILHHARDPVAFPPERAFRLRRMHL